MSFRTPLPAGLLGFGLLALGPLPAQELFDAPHKRSLPRYAGGARCATLADVDGDGDLDALVGRAIGNLLFLNDGSGRFTDVSATDLPQDDGDTFSLVTVDIDADGDLDVVCGNTQLSGSVQDRVYVNDGTGRFTDETATRLPASTEHTARVLPGDVDGDGDPDLLLVGGPIRVAVNRLLLNDGSGVFSDASANLPAANEATGSAALADFDSDGDLDIVEGNGGFPGVADRLLLNDGSGRFTPAANPLPGTPGRTIEVLADDVDGDGDLDVLSAIDNRGARLLLNDGTGTFTLAPTSQMPASFVDSISASLIDPDGDGVRDLLLATDFAEDGALYRNDGTGTYTLVSPWGALDNARIWDYAAGDVDGDSREDLYVVRFSGLSDGLLLNDGSGGWIDANADPQLPQLPGDPLRVVFGDFDGDGLSDLISVREEIAFAKGDGFGYFGDPQSQRFPAGIAADSSDVLAADLDGDQDLDLVVTRVRGTPQVLLLNDGTGHFTDASSQLPALRAVSLSAETADVDGDGDLDLLIGNSDSGTSSALAFDTLLLNDGAATFTLAGITDYPTADLRTGKIEFLDYDRDGDPDVLTLLERQVHVYTNIGQGRFRDFTPTVAPDLLTTFQERFALGDVDGDGDLDLWTGNRNGQDLYRNDGAAGFHAITNALPAPAGRLDTATFLDQDADGDEDLVVSTSSGIQLFRNDGAGRFTQVPDPIDLGGPALAQTLLPADYDGDGDEDLFVAGQFGATRFENNLIRQLSAPHLARVGANYPVRFRCQPIGTARQLPLLLSLRGARFDLGALGTFGLDPNTSFALTPIRVPAQATEGSVDLPFPNQPALLGTEFFLQALDPGDGSDPHLTNRVRDRIVR